MPNGKTMERHAIFIEGVLADRSPVFESSALAAAWLARQPPGDGYQTAAVGNVRLEASRLRRTLVDVLSRAEQLDAALTVDSPKALKRRRNRLRREASMLSDRIAQLNAIRHPVKSQILASAMGNMKGKRRPYSTYGLSSYVTVVSGGIPSLGKKR
jgi:hypothetical protein